MVPQGTIHGTIIDETTKAPVQYVNIGIAGKNTGTVSDIRGRYAILINSLFEQDSILFSCIGYKPKYVTVNELRESANEIIFLSREIYEIKEITVVPAHYKEKILGNNHHSKIMGGFRDNNKGYECGILLKIKKPTILENFSCHIARCTYDSICYRLNIYRQTGRNSFENILKQPIYIKQRWTSENRSLDIDLLKYNLVVEENTLVTLEHIEYMGEGELLFPGGLSGTTCYYRKTSQGDWKKTPVKLSFRVTVKTEE
jgi:hypothetical protein